MKIQGVRQILVKLPKVSFHENHFISSPGFFCVQEKRQGFFRFSAGCQ
jgi:hypothetical protein